MSTTPDPSTRDADPRDHEARIAAALEDIHDDLEAVAAADTAFSDRAQAALDWLDDYHTTEDADQ